MAAAIAARSSAFNRSSAWCSSSWRRSCHALIRAEAAAEDKPAAFDLALDKLMAQLRKAADRKRVHHGQHNPRSLHEATAEIPAVENGQVEVDGDATHLVAGMEVQGDGPMVVREKVHPAVPMTLDQALLEMELVGHDFYLFVNEETNRPAVVYRRHAFDYGLIELAPEGDAE